MFFALNDLIGRCPICGGMMLSGHSCYVETRTPGTDLHVKALEERIKELEAEVAVLKRRLEKLDDRTEPFR